MNERFTYLLRQYSAHNLTPDEREELNSLITASSENRKIFQTFAGLRKTGLQYDMLRHADGHTGWLRVMSRLRSRRRRRLTTRIAAAVAGLLAVTASFFFLNRHIDNLSQPTIAAIMQTEAINRAVITMPDDREIYLEGSDSVQYKDNLGNLVYENKNGNLTYHSQFSEPIYNTVTVGEGSTYKITLCDGTRITLASGSEMTYPVGGTKRDVKLKGEALFDVAPDKKHPFTVECPDNVTITVLGTRFNVVAYGHQPTVITLESGRVDFCSSNSCSQLNPGDQVTISTDGRYSVTHVNARLYTSWAEGIYDFNNVTLRDIIQELSLWYGVQFEFSDQQLGERKFTGVLLRNKNLNYSLNLLHDVSNLEFSTDGEKIIIQ